MRTTTESVLQALEATTVRRSGIPATFDLQEKELDGWRWYLTNHPGVEFCSCCSMKIGPSQPSIMILDEDGMIRFQHELHHTLVGQAPRSQTEHLLLMVEWKKLLMGAISKLKRDQELVAAAQGGTPRKGSGRVRARITTRARPYSSPKPR